MAQADEFKAFEHAGWDGIPAQYDAGFGALTVQSIGPMLDAVSGAGLRLLDVASGPGYVADAAAKRGFDVTGVDFAAAMVREAKRRAPRIDFREGDAEALPFEASSFDAVVINFGVLHLARPEQAIAEAFRVLRPGGRFAFTVWAPPERAVAFGIVLGAVRAHGNPDAPLPPGPPFFRYSDARAAGDALLAAGFVEPRSVEVPQQWRLASGEALFDIMLGGTVRTGGLLRAQTPEALSAIRGAVIDGVAPYRDGKGIELPMPAVLSSARKPS